MKWSKCKKQLEDRLAPALNGRVKYHLAMYRKLNEEYGRAWISFDKEEIHNFSEAKHHMEKWRVGLQIQELNNGLDFRHPNQREEYYRALEEANQIVHQQDIFSLRDFLRASYAYLSLSIDNALNHDSPIIRGMAMLDRRLGKRRLKNLFFSPTESNMVLRLYELRCRAENIEI